MILHSCDNGQWPIGCCNPYHMRIGNHVENSHDMMMRQRHGLPRVVVKAIRRLLDAGKTHEQIAELYGIGRTTVTMIANHRAHVHVEMDDDDISDTEPPSAVLNEP